MNTFKEFIAEKDIYKENYKEYFNKMLKKYSVESPDDLSDKDKKKFFDEVDAGWKAEKETDED